MNFNQEQIQAVRHKDGPMLVLAGPGSGKTAVITARTVFLIEQCQVAPSSILVVTFTKAAAAQMKERFLSATKGRHRQVQFGTFHGIFYGILKHAYGLGSGSVIGEGERYRLLKELMLNSKMEPEDEKEALEMLSREISTVKTEQIPLEHFYSSGCPEEVFREIYCSYQSYLSGRRLLDFDDLLICCYELLSERPDIRKRWQERFAYIQIDEFQDINALQYKIIRMLSKPRNNLFAVGDDDQSIYRFRGAKPEMMFTFQKDYPKAKQVILKQNYRCSKAIVHCSQRLIRCNHNRFEKDLRTENDQGEAVEIHPFSCEDAQGDYLVESIQNLIKAGCEPEEIAVLFRTNIGSRRAVSRLMAYNIPFVLRDSLPNLYDHWIARHVLAYLRIAKGGRAKGDFLMIMNKPNRYISREAVYGKEISFESLYQFYEEKTWMCDRIEKLEDDLKAMALMAPFAAINYLRCSIGYETYLREYAAERRIKPEELIEVLDEIQESSRNYRTFEEWCAFIQEYTMALQRQKEKKQETGVMLSTLHGAKGLEYRHVFILDVNEGMIPYHKAVLPQELEEERRLLYVGMTRAKETLHLFYSQRHFDRRQEPSRFLREILGEELP